jgi:hypothetical protein
MSPAELETKNDCVGYGQQKFTRKSWQHSQSWFCVPWGRMAIFFILFNMFAYFEMGLPTTGGGLTVIGHSPSTGEWLNGFSLTNWLFPPHRHTHKIHSTNWVTAKLLLVLASTIESLFRDPRDSWPVLLSHYSGNPTNTSTSGTAVNLDNILSIKAVLID